MNTALGLRRTDSSSSSSLRRRGAAFILLTVVLLIVVGGLTGAVLTVAFTYQRAAAEMLNREQAYRAAESGVAYYLVQLIADQDYFVDNGAWKPVSLGSVSFQLESAERLEGSDSWQLVVRGTCDGIDYALNAVLGPKEIRIPSGIVATGTGKSADVILELKDRSTVASYDPDDGPYDPSSPGDEAKIAANGSIDLSAANVYGEVTASGTIDQSGSTISGDVSENAAETAVEDIDPIVYDAMSSSKVANDNAKLAAVFGKQWAPVAGTQNYGDLIVTKKATYVIPAGKYRFRRLEVRNGATVIFDTSSAPSQLVYVGSGKGTGTGNDLIVTGGSAVKVSPGESGHGLLTVLGPDCDFMISAASVFGQATTEPANAGYTQIISLGGNTSSDAISVTGGSSVYGRLYAAAHAFSISGSSWYGSAVARTVELDKSALFAVDRGGTGTRLGGTSGDYEIVARSPAPLTTTGSYYKN
jgi:hypothetical protein